MMKPRIVITGVAGFIGSNLAEALLADGYRVVGIDNLAYGITEQIPNGVDFRESDIRAPELSRLIEKGDVIFHLAAKNCISDCQQDPVDTASANVAGTVNVFDAARIKRARKVIYAESSALYEGSANLPTPETEVRPESFYAVSKFAAMVFAEAYRRFYGLRTTALRYFCVYGPRQDYRRTIPPVMSAFILEIMRGRRPVIYGSGLKRRDFIHVDDVNAFHLRCIDDPHTDDRVFNLGTGRSHSVLEIFERVARLLNYRLPPVHRPDLPGEANETLADISSARAVGWEPRIGLEEGLGRFVQYYEAHPEIVSGAPARAAF